MKQKKKKSAYLYRVFLILVLLAGGGIALYPSIANYILMAHQAELIDAYESTVKEMKEEELQAIWEEAEDYNNLLSGQDIVDPFMPQSGYVLPENYLNILNVNGIMAGIRIPKIDQNLNIRHGTGEEVLRQGVGHMEMTAFPIGGEGNHTVLTGHRGLPSAKLFTDLDKLEEGDLFYIDVLRETLVYEVDQILVIDPGDTNELRPVDGEDYVTLVTCTPYGVNSHRLLVRGKRTEEKEAAEPEQGLKVPVLVIIALFFIAVMFCWVFYRRKNRKNRVGMIKKVSQRREK